MEMGDLMLAMAGAARTFSAMVFFAASASVLTACYGVSGDSPGFTPQEQASPSVSAAVERVASKYVSTSTPGSAGYLIGPQDVLDITVFQVPDLSKTVQVAENGTINLPLVGLMPAAGNSSQHLEHEIQARLNARYLKSSQVTVFVKEYNSQRVTVEGAIKSPGVYPLRGDQTLMQTLAKGGGIDNNTASNDVVIFRNVDGARTMVRYDISTILSGDATDPRVFAGDVIVVSDSAAKTGLNLFLKVLPVAGYTVPFI